MYMNFFAPLFRSVLGHVDDVLVQYTLRHFGGICRYCRTLANIVHHFYTMLWALLINKCKYISLCYRIKINFKLCKQQQSFVLVL